MGIALAVGTALVLIAGGVAGAVAAPPDLLTLPDPSVQVAPTVTQDPKPSATDPGPSAEPGPSTEPGPSAAEPSGAHPSAAGSPIVIPTTPAGPRPRTLLAVLLGTHELAPGGDPDGRGSAHVSVSADRSHLCYLVTVSRLAGTVTTAHIHHAPNGAYGPIVVMLTPPVDGTFAECVKVDPALGADIAAYPREYYVNIHTSAFPGGAVRGQLHGGHP